MISSVMIPQSMKTSIIRIDSYENKIMCGRMTNSYLDDEKIFTNYMELVFIIDKMLANIEYFENAETRQFNERRRRLRQITGRRQFMNKPDIKTVSQLRLSGSIEGKLGTFVIRIISRQNSDWQGKVVWLEQNQTQYFRSILELAKLIDSAISEPPPRWDTPPKSGEDEDKEESDS